MTRRMTFAILASSLVLAETVPLACSQQKREEDAPSILHAKGDSVRVQLLDVASGRPITDAEVGLSSDNGVRCVQPPCPTNGQQWTGRSDTSGQVVIPKTALQAVTTVETPGHDGDLIEDSAPAGDGGWTAELFPRDTSDTASRPIKLIDGRSGAAIAKAPVRLEFRVKDGGWDSVTTTSNELGYVFVPFRVVTTAAEQSWVVVPGYRRTLLDFAWARRRTMLQRL